MSPLLVILVQVHSMWQRLLDVTDFDRQIGSQVPTVDLNGARVVLVVAPHLDLLSDEMEVGASLEVE